MPGPRERACKIRCWLCARIREAEYNGESHLWNYRLLKVNIEMFPNQGGEDNETSIGEWILTGACR